MDKRGEEKINDRMEMIESRFIVVVISDDK